jgi:hypothetical protein
MKEITKKELISAMIDIQGCEEEELNKESMYSLINNLSEDKRIYFEEFTGRKITRLNK